MLHRYVLCCLDTLVIACNDGPSLHQIVHLPTLQLLSHLFITQAICDVSLKTASHCAAKFSIGMATTDPNDIFQNESIDIVFVLTSDEFHVPLTVAALQAGKSVMVEKPITLSLQSCEEILEAEGNAPNHARVFVGYMRRYAPTLSAFKREISTIEAIKYVRVRDIIGPNSYFIGQSGCYPVKFNDDVTAEARQERTSLLSNLFEEAWGVPYSELNSGQLNYCYLLGSLGSHGLGVMREVLGGLPEEVIASTDNARWYTTMFDYQNHNSPHDHFTCTYEMGLDSVPRFDSKVTVYGENKTVTLCYDTPFVKGLGITVEIDEMNEHGEKVHRSIQTSYEDAYTTELKELHSCLVEHRPFKTTATDAMEDLKLLKMMLDKYPEHKRGSAGQKSAAGFVPSGP